MNYWFGRRHRRWTVFDTAILVIVFIAMFVIYVMSPKQYIHCIKSVGCRVYNQETMLSQKVLSYKFNPQDIVSYDVKAERHYHRRGGTHYSYYPIIALKDGTTIPLDTFKLRSRGVVDNFIIEMKTKNNYKKCTPSMIYQMLFN